MASIIRKPAAVIGLILPLLLVANSSWASACKAVDQYLKWRGGDAFTQLQSLEMAGTVEGYGREATSRVALRRDHYSLQEFSLQNFTVLLGLTPDQGWSKQPYGRVKLASQAERNEGRHWLDLTLALSLQDEGKGEVRCLGKRKKGRVSYNVVRVTYDGDHWFEYYLAPRNGALSWIRRSEAGNISWERHRSWVRINGVRFARKVQVKSDDHDLTMHWQQITPNPKLPLALFTHPRGETHFCEFSGQDHTSGWIDFDFYRQKQIFLQATVNGTQQRVLLDSAASTTVIDRRLADKLGLKGMKGVTVSGTTGTAQAEMATGVTIKVGNLTIRNHPVAIIDLSKVTSQEIPVILGAEVFNELVVDIDYPNERLAFHLPECFSSDHLANPIAVVPGYRGLKQVAVSVNGLEPAMLELDTGLSYGVVLFKPWTDANRLLEELQTTDSPTVGIGGSATYLSATVDSLQVGEELLTDVPVNFSRQEKGSSATDQIAGLIGTQIFKHYRTTFDLTRNLLYLTPPRIQQ